jgi:hypothetical protein
VKTKNTIFIIKNLFLKERVITMNKNVKTGEQLLNMNISGPIALSVEELECINGGEPPSGCEVNGRWYPDSALRSCSRCKTTIPKSWGHLCPKCQEPLTQYREDARKWRRYQAQEERINDECTVS